MTDEHGEWGRRILVDMSDTKNPACAEHIKETTISPFLVHYTPLSSHLTLTPPLSHHFSIIAFCFLRISSHFSRHTSGDNCSSLSALQFTICFYPTIHVRIFLPTAVFPLSKETLTPTKLNQFPPFCWKFPPFCLNFQFVLIFLQTYSSRNHFFSFSAIVFNFLFHSDFDLFFNNLPGNNDNNVKQ